MSKLTKRLLCIAVMALVIISLSLLGFAEEGQQPWEPECYQHGDVNTDGDVDTRDAVYVLYHIMFEQYSEQFPEIAERYRIDQDWDYEQDGLGDTKDAIYLLYRIQYAKYENEHPEYKDLFPLRGVIHDYYDPSWVWDDAAGTATVTFKCGCGQPATYTTGNGVAVTEGAKVEATCVAAGSQVYTASVTVDGEEYTNTYVKTLPAGNGHKMVGTQDCVNSSSCSLCGHTLAALGHNWTLESSTGATCTTDAYETYRCSVCQATDKVTQEGTAAHSMQYLEDRQTGCAYTKWYKCANCDHTAPGQGQDDVYYKHTYTAELTQDATCTVPGVKTYTCSGCGDDYTEEVPVNDSHDWIKGETDANGVTPYTCSRNTEHTKTTVEAKKDTALSTEALQNELQLSDDASTDPDEKTISMKLDDATINALENDVKVDVSTVDPTLAGLTPEQQAQIGNSKVYNFNMTYASDDPENADKVSKFAGKITISLPYELEEGEDVDSINVWYIDDKGNLTAVEATYSNGFVTFTTDHFSYYTVTRLTPAERCAAYGHVMVERSKAATCTEDGFEMELCQRCGEVTKNEAKEHSGHAFQKTVTAEATCDKAGAFEEVCSTCNAKVLGTIPAIGHNMQKDDSLTVIASCKQAGKEVSVCANGCGHTVEITKPQLNHEFESYEDVDPTCNTKGYKTNKCKLCDEVVTEKEFAPLGHNFSAATAKWNWSADHLSATVTLECSRNPAHTKELTAVVTEEIQASSCLAGGSVTYTAAASFNNVPFTNIYTESTAAAGHTPGTKWETNASQHYHICEKCDTKVDAASHTWSEGVVTLEPTCDDKGSERFTCLICDYVLDKDIPATGEHTYVGGVCSGCGREEGECFHLKTTPTELDLSAYNLCKGTSIIKISCECGENTRYDYDLSCNIDYDVKPETVIIDGQECTKYTYTCDDCGLVMEELYMQRSVPDACAKEYVCQTTFFKGDQQIATTEMAMGAQPHAGVTLVETVDLTAEEYGLCTEKIEFYVCGCDKEVITSRVAESCDWMYEGYNEQTQEGTYRCADCEAVRVIKNRYEQEEGSCEAVQINTYTYYMGEDVVYTYTITYPYYEHQWQVDSCKLFGDSCEDGVHVLGSCKLCGETTEDYLDWHETIETSTVDLSGYDFCAESVRIDSCPCKLAQRHELIYPKGSDGCQWVDVPSGIENVSTRFCSVCGVTANRVFAESKDENCVHVAVNAYTYSDINGDTILTANDNWVEIDHVYEILPPELLGESCMDGVKVTRICKDCGYTYSGQHYWHEAYVDQVYDLSELGICQEGLQVRKCPCGVNVIYDWISDNGECYWNQIHGEGNENHWLGVYQCATCHAVYQEEIKTMATDDPCIKQQVTTLSFYKNLEDREPVKVISFSGTYASHDVLASFQLNDSTLGCAGGYTIIESCQNCDYSESWTNPGNSSHDSMYMVAKEKVSKAPLCEEIYLCTYSCPCGTRTSMEERYAGDAECQWQWSGPDTATCSQCQVTRTEEYSRVKVEGTTCQYKSSWAYTYTFEGEELFSYTTENTNFNHRNVATFEMEGQTCLDGYYINNTCLDCGAQTRGWDMGCSSHPVERFTAVKDEDACGIVELVHSKCPCGAQDRWSLNGSCNWSHTGYDDNGNTKYTCLNCGMLKIGEETETRIPNTCRYQVSLNHTYQLGEKTYKLEKDYTYTRHNLLAVFDCPSGNCEDGYSVYWKCQYCDYTEDRGGNGTGHATFQTAYYDLADYGMCGGTIWQRICACGKESEWGWNLGVCDGRPSGNTDPDTGDHEYYCETCQSYYSWGEVGERDPETCTVNGTFYFKLRNAEESLLNLQGATRRTSHEGRVTSATLMNPDAGCDGGVRYFYQCEDCGLTWEGTSSGHSTYAVMEIETSCGSYVTHRKCACGYTNRVEYGCENMGGRSWEDTDDNGVVHAYYESTCSDCGLYVLRDYFDVELEGCDVERTYVYTVRYGDREEVIRYTREEEAHSFGPETGALQPGATTCEDGIVISRTCADCGHVETWVNNYHQTFPQEEVNLADLGACGGILRIHRCPCGLVNTYTTSGERCSSGWRSWTETGDDGVEYWHEEKVCDYCEMTTTTVTHYAATEDPCQHDRYTELTIRCGNNERTFSLRSREENHDRKYSYILFDGAESCEDGVHVSWYCTRCDASSGWESHSHDNYLKETIDLRDFGSICGGTLENYACACGKYNHWQLSEDVQCDLDDENLSCWIEGAINEYRPNIHQSGTYSYGHLYRCAVTDPESCPLTIRYATYWLKADNCTAVHYELWQLGYDEETGTCQRELSYPTGQVMTFHDYEEADLFAVKEEGGRIEGTLYTCKACQSTYTDRTDIDADGYAITREYTYVNKLNDGNRKYYSNVETYGVIDGENVIIVDRFDYTEADGSTSWEERRYTYDIEGCSRTCVYTYSNRESETRKEVYHFYFIYHNETKAKTCSQPGYYHWWYSCDSCGKITSQNKHDYLPGHSWNWNEYEQQYVCGTCGLRNKNGADGAIIMEDLTATYGNGAEYVIGYYNPDNIQFVANVSVILDNVTEGDNQIDLGITEFTDKTTDADGYTGLSFNKAAADAAAAAAVAAIEGGYEGTYAIRISFVPANGTDTLDYAITFDSVTAE